MPPRALRAYTPGGRGCSGTSTNSPSEASGSVFTKMPTPRPVLLVRPKAGLSMPLTRTRISLPCTGLGAITNWASSALIRLTQALTRKGILADEVSTGLLLITRMR